MVEPRAHWEKVYSSKPAAEMSWFQPHLATSLELLERSGIAREDEIIDVGAGASTLVDDLLDHGYMHLTVLDVSSQAIELSKERLGNRASLVHWVAGNILDVSLPHQRYGFWHDRAVFHFLTEAEDRKVYVRQLRNALRPDGFALISTFSLEGPLRCSGLDVCRYSCDSLLSEFGSGFRLLESRTENHRTPHNAIQAFTYCLFVREER